jgi:hypothetical protein
MEFIINRYFIWSCWNVITAGTYVTWIRHAGNVNQTFLTYYSYHYSWDGARLRPPVLPASDERWENFWNDNWQGNNEVHGRNLPQCHSTPLQISHARLWGSCNFTSKSSENNIEFLFGKKKVTRESKITKMHTFLLVRRTSSLWGQEQYKVKRYICPCT